MNSSRPPFRSILITHGVNAPAGGTPLAFANKDSDDLHTLLTTKYGPQWTATDHACGANATSAAVTKALRDVANTRPDFLLWYFAGHGSESGIALADRHFYFNELVRLMSAVNAGSSLLILDTCHAAGYQLALRVKEASFPKPAGLPELPWREQMQLSVKRPRYMFAARVDQNSRESAQYGGHFTWALRSALAGLPGDLDGWISDWAAFRYTSDLVQQFGLDQTPVAEGLDGTFPLYVGNNYRG